MGLTQTSPLPSHRVTGGHGHLLFGGKIVVQDVAHPLRVRFILKMDALVSLWKVVSLMTLLLSVPTLRRLMFHRWEVVMPRPAMRPSTAFSASTMVTTIDRP